MNSEEVESLLNDFEIKEINNLNKHCDKHLDRICKYLKCVINNIKNYQMVSCLSYFDNRSNNIIDETICILSRIVRNAECKHNYEIVSKYKKELRKVLGKLTKIRDGKYERGIIYEKLMIINHILCNLLAIFCLFKNNL